MLFFVNQGFRVVAADRRGHGRSSQVGTGHDMDHYADDLAAVTEHLDLHDAVHIGHSTGGGEVVRYITRHGESRVAKAVLISSVPPLMVQTESNPGGLPKSVFDDFQAQLLANRSNFYWAVASGPCYGYNRLGADPSQPIIWNWWRQGMTGAAKAHYDGIVAFSQTDFTEELKRITVPTLVMHGDDPRSCRTRTPVFSRRSYCPTAPSRSTRASRTECRPPRHRRSTPTCSRSSGPDQAVTRGVIIQGRAPVFRDRP
jgi:non-heme chloroperoxidase